MVYNAFDRHLYATVPGSFGANGNSVVVVDPAQQSIVKFIPVGSEPKALALSDDGKVLWVVNTGAGSLRRVDLTSLTAGAEFPLGTPASVSGQRLTILPGTHDSVAVLTNGITIYDNGVPRANAAFAGTSPIVGTNSPFLLYGFDSNSTGNAFVTYCVNATGVFAQRAEVSIFGGFGSNLLFDSGVVYGNNAAYDIRKQQVIGTYPSAPALAIDPLTRRIFSLTAFNAPLLSAYDMDTFVAAGTDASIPSGNLFQPLLTRWGRYGIAFTQSADFYNAGTLYVGRSVLVP